jgi:hypothetical protein
MDLEKYDEILDALDDEDISKLTILFNKYNLDPNSLLYDTPRLDQNYNELYTYLDYSISYSLTNVIDFFIEEMGLSIDDDILARTIKLDNPELYNHFCKLGYYPDETTFKTTVQMCFSEIVANILESDNEFINYIDSDDIECLFNNTLDEETIETIRVLINYGINTNLFEPFLESIKEKTNDELNEDENDIAIELIDLFSNLDVSNK